MKMIPILIEGRKRAIMTEIFTGSSLEEAKQNAANAFGVSVSEIEFTVLEEPKRSLLGGLFGKKDADFRVQAVYEPRSAAEVIEQSAATIEQGEVAMPAESADSDIAEPADAEETEAEIPQEILLEKMALGVKYLEQVLAQYSPETKVEAELKNGISINLSGDDAGALIGKRGETLDALQYLTSMVANRGDKDYVRLTLDTCGYRERRKQTLVELAQRLSSSAIKKGRPVTLEPMNPYERRVIHSTVTEIEGVSSHSVGEEPYRKVIITPDHVTEHAGRPRRSGGRFDRSERGERGGNRGERGKRPQRERHSSTEGPRKLDLSTSFEKDYKRPKPEDSLNAGVYGKIDI